MVGGDGRPGTVRPAALWPAWRAYHFSGNAGGSGKPCADTGGKDTGQAKCRTAGVKARQDRGSDQADPDHGGAGVPGQNQAPGRAHPEAGCE